MGEKKRILGVLSIVGAGEEDPCQLEEGRPALATLSSVLSSLAPVHNRT